MAKALLVARRELNTYFKSWNGYIIAAAILFIEGILFNAFAIGNESKFSTAVLTDFFYFASGLSIISGLFLAMRLIAEEKDNSTILLFFTAPVTERSFVYGKFLSALTFAVILHIISLYLPLLIFVHGKISLGHLVSGYAVLILLSATSIAISLFGSALAPNQLMAGVISAIILVFLLVIWMMAGITTTPFAQIFSYLSIHNQHFNSFANGIFELKHLVYYVSVCVFFIEATIKIIEVKRRAG